MFQAPVASFAVLADDDRNWKPDSLTLSKLGTRLNFSYSIVKLTDMNEAELEQSDNPFAVIILAHLRAMRTAHDPESRRRGKVGLIKHLYQRWDREEIGRLIRLIDWLMQLPKDLELKVQEEMQSFDQEKQMSYVPFYLRAAQSEGEAKGKAEGLQDGIAFGLKLKFGPAGSELMPEVRQITDVERLHRILDAIEQSTQPDQVRRVWAD